jgi:hypothetical protein
MCTRSASSEVSSSRNGLLARVRPANRQQGAGGELVDLARTTAAVLDSTDRDAIVVALRRVAAQRILAQASRRKHEVQVAAR